MSLPLQLQVFKMCQKAGLASSQAALAKHPFKHVILSVGDFPAVSPACGCLMAKAIRSGLLTNEEPAQERAIWRSKRSHLTKHNKAS